MNNHFVIIGVTFRGVRSSYLRVKIREECTPRRHVDLIDDHCHASCQIDFPLAIRQVRSLLLSGRPSRHSRTTRSCSSHYQMYLSARFASKWLSQEFPSNYVPRKTISGKIQRARLAKRQRTIPVIGVRRIPPRGNFSRESPREGSRGQPRFPSSLPWRIVPEIYIYFRRTTPNGPLRMSPLGNPVYLGNAFHFTGHISLSPRGLSLEESVRVDN